MTIPSVTIPSPIILGIPFIISPLLGWLQDDGLPKFVNALLAALFILLTAGACLLLGGLITPDIQGDIWLYLAYAFAILNYGPCAALRQMVMDALSSPLLALVKKDPQVTQPTLAAVPKGPTVATNAVLPSQLPRPIVLPKPNNAEDHSG